MADPLDEVLRLVADGWLTAEEAAPVIDALQATGGPDGAADDANARTGGSTSGSDGPTSSGASARPRVLRLEVSEAGRKVVNLRVPLSLGRMALSQIPGLTADSVSRIRSALDEGLTGPILVVDEDDEGDGVRIILE
jgi:hypothetical protein